MASAFQAAADHLAGHPEGAFHPSEDLPEGHLEADEAAYASFAEADHPFLLAKPEDRPSFAASYPAGASLQAEASGASAV